MRISGITIPDNKRLEFGLCFVYGVGRSSALGILKDVGIDPSKKPSDLSDEEESALRTKVEGGVIEGELRRTISANIKRLKDIKSNRGIRHARGMKVRGQRTKTNNRTVPGGIKAVHKSRKTMTSGRRKVEKK